MTLEHLEMLQSNSLRLMGATLSLDNILDRVKDARFKISEDGFTYSSTLRIRESDSTVKISKAGIMQLEKGEEPFFLKTDSRVEEFYERIKREYSIIKTKVVPKPEINRIIYKEKLI